MTNGEKYFPVGTVVLLKNARKRIMITGFAVTSPEKEGKMYDYVGCLYPEGIINSDKNLLFDHDQIAKIYYMGYIDMEWKKTENKIKELVEKQTYLQKDVWSYSIKNDQNGEPSKTIPSSENMFRVRTDLFD